MKSLTMKRIFTVVACIAALLVGGFLLASCGEKVVTDYSELINVISQAGAGVNDEDNTVSTVYVSFYSEPSSIKATYNGEEITLESSSYDNEGTTEYQYLYTATETVSVEDYNENPVVIRCTIDGTTYEFNLTTNLIDQLFEAIM